MSMRKRLFENYSKADRIRALRDNAERAEDFHYFKNYDQEEMEALKDQYFQDAAELKKYEDALAMAKVEFKMNATPIKDSMREAFSGIQSKGRTVTEQVYLLADHEAGMMEYYNEAGDLVHTRRLLPDERQLRMKIEATGTND